VKKPIYLLCLHNCRTGGPEAIHQLSDALLAQGFDARLLYYQKPDVLNAQTKDGRYIEYWGVPRELPDYLCPFPEYAHYATRLARSIEEPGVVVLPETMAHLAPLFPAHTVLIWWLSVDNGLHALSKAVEAGSLNLLRGPNVWHATQSRYAEAFVCALQFHSAGMLSDYTTDLTVYADPSTDIEQRPKLAVFATKRVTADLQAIVDEIQTRDPEINCVPLASLSRAELAQLLAQARVYVDCGSFPGKDRGPREAIQMGCTPLVFAVGAAMETGALGFLNDVAGHVVEHVNHPWPEQLVLPDERAIFFDEVCNVFSRL